MACKILKKGKVLCIVGLSLGVLLSAGCSDGKDGADGINGTRWYADSQNVDSITYGENGDFYFDTDDYKLYQKENETWILKVENFGKSGKDGIDGIDGEDGVDGTNGKNGTTPTVSINSDGYWVINGVATEVKAKGADGTNGKDGIDGIDGVDGTNGENGKDGASWLVGLGAPNDTAGKDGDLYLDNQYWDMYQKVDAEWSWIGNISGKTNITSNAKDSYVVSETAPSITLSVTISGKTKTIPVTSEMFVNEPDWSCPGTHKMIIKCVSATYSKYIDISYQPEEEEITDLTIVNGYKLTMREAANETQTDGTYTQYIDFTDISKYDEVIITCGLWRSSSSDMHTAIKFYNAKKEIVASYSAENLATYGVTIPSATSAAYNVNSLVLPTNGATYIRFSNKTEMSSSENTSSDFNLVTAKLVGRCNYSGLKKSENAPSVSYGSYIKGGDNDLVFNGSRIANQGGAAYGKYFFQFVDGLKGYVYDLETQETLCIKSSFAESNAEYHCNNANFGTELYEDTGFPLLYVSQEHKNQHKALVYAVSKNGNDFNFELKQTIVYPSNEDAEMYYQQGFIDGENKYIYIVGYSKESYTSNADGNILKIKKYALPSVDDGETVYLNAEDVIFETHMPFSAATQGGFIKDGKLFEAFGAYEADRKLRIIDLKTGIYQEIDLNINAEPENIFIYNNEYYIADVNDYIRKLILTTDDE